MTCAPAALLVVLAAAAAGPPDLQVEAVSQAGVALPDLADATARALVAGGARVVLRGPTSGPCDHCAKVKVIEAAPETLRIEVSNNDRVASTTLRLPASSALFDRARAIAIQARLLVASHPEGDTEAVRPRPRSAKSRSQVAAEVPVSPPVAPADQGAVDASEGEGDEGAAVAADEAAGEDASDAGTATVVPAPPPAPAKPVLDVRASESKAPTWSWPWIPTALGAAAAVAAGACAMTAWNRYTSLSDKTQSYDSARQLKASGQSWQLASFIMSGVAVASLGVGIAGFAVRAGRASHTARVSAVASPVPGGAVAVLGGPLP